MTLKRFFLTFIFGLSGLLALIALFNRIVDPFWYYRDIEIKGFNAVKTQFADYERHVKPLLLAREKPEAIILGSSFSEIGLDPTNPFFTDHGRLKSMNFAFGGAPWGMVQCEFEFAVAHAPIKRALVGFIPGNLPLVDCAKDYSSIGQISAIQLLLSDSALQASINTIFQQDRMPSHSREGMYYMPPLHHSAPDHGLREHLLQGIRRYHHGGNLQCPKPAGTASIRGNLDSNEAVDLSGLQRMIRTAQKHGIELVLYAYPKHAYMMELENRCDDQDTKWQALKQIAKLIDAESASGDNVRAYQFYGYNDITAERMEGSHARYWHDPGHFTAEVGNNLLLDMFGGGSPKLGHLLSAATLDSEYQDFLQGRTNYLTHHPKFMTDFNNLVSTSPINQWKSLSAFLYSFT
jgi:hypothetical protein